MYGYVVIISDIQYIVYIYMYIMECKIISNLDIFGYLWTLDELYQRQRDVPGRVTIQDDWSFQVGEFSPWFPSFPDRKHESLLWVGITRQTGQARDLQSNLSSMAPRSQGCKRCSGVDTVRQLFLCLDILSLGTQFYWKKFPGWKTSWIEIQSEGDILFIFRNCLLPQNHVLEYPSLTPYRDGYMRYSIKCFRILRCCCIPTFSCEKTALADIYLLDAPLLSLSRGIVAWGAAS
jgi:hypothetical protein